MPASLRTLYRRTLYQAAGITVRVGARSLAMDRLLASERACCAVFITAWNPFSRRMPDGWNVRMQGRLAEALRRDRALPAHGAFRGWAEAHVLVFTDPRKAAVIARRFRQNAIVISRIRQPSGLFWTSRGAVQPVT